MQLVLRASLWILVLLTVQFGTAQHILEPQRPQPPQQGLEALFVNGTAIPVSLPGLSSSSLKPGDTIVAKTTQVIALEDEQKVPAGSKLTGHVIEATPNKPSSLTIKFDSLHFHGQEIPVRVALRAMTNFPMAQAARHGSALDPSPVPVFMMYRLVGGDFFREREGPVFTSWGMRIGTSTRDGVFTRLAELQPLRDTDRVMCPAADTLQSVGVFSSQACGLYGMGSLMVEDVVSADNAGVEIRFASNKRTVKIAAGCEALLQIVGPEAANQTKAPTQEQSSIPLP